MYSNTQICSDAPISIRNQVHYYNSKEPYSIYNFCKTLTQLITSNNKSSDREVVFLCIGSDRATGDCLGPIIGYKLSQLHLSNLNIYGTLSQPVHAKNLSETLQTIKEKHPTAFIVAIDASLGSNHHVGYITLGEGAIQPGVGVNKQLPSVGDIFITGIVNISGSLSHALLQTTRLDLVMQLADYICLGIRYSLHHTNPAN